MIVFMGKGKSIYVETLIKTTMNTLWNYTQTPDLHQQWDVRFTEITYIPKSRDDEPQRFLYKTNIGFGLSISGEGVSVGNIGKDGILISSLKFSTSNPISLLSEGAGFWRYEPTSDGIRFITRYDYKTRFGVFGTWLDHLIFRPIMGYATAWSFDCLRLWIERGIPPRILLRRALTEMISITTLFFIWIYQGLVPKILVPDSGELEMMNSLVVLENGRHVLTALGVGEIVFGILLLLLRGKKRIVWHKLNIVILVLLGLSASATPATYVAPFNPVTLNVAMVALSLISLMNATDIPRAGNCRREEVKP